MKDIRLEQFIDNYIEQFESTSDKWDREDGCVLTGMQMMHEVTGEEKYKKFILDYLQRYIGEDGTINICSGGNSNVDAVSIGKSLFFAYAESGDERYRKAIEALMDCLRSRTRTKEGSFWHSNTCAGQVWLEDSYSNWIFYMIYDTKYGKKEHYNDIINQFKLMRKNLFDEKKRLYCSAYDESRQAEWADMATGLSGDFLIHSIGLHLIALIECIDAIDEGVYEYYNDLKQLFKEAVKGLLQYQDKNSKIFRHMPDKGDVKENGPDASGSAMAACAMLKACRKRVILAEKYQDNAKNIFDSAAALVCDNPSAFGAPGEAGPVIMAYSEILRMDAASGLI